MPEATRCGFIAVLGAPNVGKSTLINQFVGAKVSIVTHKVQTTRTRVLGIMIHEASQLVFIDTPGIFEPKRRFDRAMVDAAWRGAADADRIMVLVDAKRGIDRNTERLISSLAEWGQPALLVINKIDLVKRNALLAMSADLNARHRFDETFMVSALNGDGVGDIVEYLAAAAPEGTWMFPEDQLSDLPQRLMAAEITREHLFLKIHQEIPYATTIETESWENFKDGSVKISQTVYVQRDTQKAIVLGKGGRQVKEIGAAAREEMSALFGCKVHLFIHVKVRDKWMEDPSRYSAWGLNYNA